MEDIFRPLMNGYWKFIENSACSKLSGRKASVQENIYIFQYSEKNTPLMEGMFMPLRISYCKLLKMPHAPGSQKGKRLCWNINTLQSIRRIARH